MHADRSETGQHDNSQPFYTNDKNKPGLLYFASLPVMTSVVGNSSFLAAEWHGTALPLLLSTSGVGQHGGLCWTYKLYIYLRNECLFSGFMGNES